MKTTHTYPIPFSNKKGEITLKDIPFTLEMTTKEKPTPQKVTLQELSLMFKGGLHLREITSLAAPNPDEETFQDFITDQLKALEKSQGKSAVNTLLRMALSNYAHESAGEENAPERLEELAEAIQTPAYLQT